MAKHLVLGESAAGTWTLPDDADVDEVRRALADAMREGSVLEVRVRVNDAPPMTTTLLVNGAVLRVAAVFEVPEATGIGFF